MTVKTLLAAVLLASIPAAASAQPGPAPQDARPLDAQQYAERAAEADLLEIETGQMASESAHDPEVRRFGERLAADHAAASERLMAIAQEQNLDAAAMSPEQASARIAEKTAPLEGLSGEEFDAEFLRLQVDAHKQSIDLHQSYAADGDDAQLRAHAETALPKLRAHLDQARRLREDG